MIKFQSEKLVKSETPSFILARVGLEGVQIARTISKIGVHIFIWNGHPNLWSNFNSEKLVKSETPPFIFTRVGLEGVQMARTIAKVGIHVFISNGHARFSFLLECGFDRARLKGGQNSSERRESWCECLSIQYASKPMIRFQFWEFGQCWDYIL